MTMKYFGEFVGLSTADSFSKYLGLHVTLGGRKFALFRWLGEKVFGKMQDTRLECDTIVECWKRNIDQISYASISSICDESLSICSVCL